MSIHTSVANSKFVMSRVNVCGSICKIRVTCILVRLHLGELGEDWGEGGGRDGCIPCKYMNHV